MSNNLNLIYWCWLNPNDIGPINHVKDFLKAMSNCKDIGNIIVLNNNYAINEAVKENIKSPAKVYTINTKHYIFDQLIAFFVFIRLLLTLKGKKFFYFRYCSFLLLPICLKMLRVKNVFLEVNGVPNLFLLEGKRRPFIAYLRKQLLFRFDKLLFKLADQLLTVCSAFRDNMVDNYKVKKNIIIIPNGFFIENSMLIDKDSAKRKLGLDCKNKYCIYIGTLADYAGVEFLMEAFQAFCSYVDNRDMVLLILGSGSLSQNQNFRSNIETNNNIDHIGNVSRDKMREYLAASDLGIYTPPEIGYNKDRQRGGNPLKIVDYLSSGLPVLVPKSDYYEYVEQNKLGSVFESGNIESFCASLQALMRNQVKLAEFGSNAKDYAMKNLQWKITLSKLFEAIERIYNC